MLARLLLLLIVIPLTDLLVLLWIAQHTSAGFAFALVLAGGIAGVAVMRWQGFYTWRHVRREIDAGQTPAVALFDSLLIFVAGVLFFIPGVLTDIAAAGLLLPPVRRAVLAYLRRRIEIRLYGRANPKPPARDTIIESRVIESRVVETPPQNSAGEKPKL